MAATAAEADVASIDMPEDIYDAEEDDPHEVMQ
jgi:hypothetical protein